MWVRAFVLASAIMVVTLPARAARQGDVPTVTLRLISTETYSKVLNDRAPTNEHSKGDVIV